MLGLADVRECSAASVKSDSVTSGAVAHQAPLFMRILQARILEWVAMPSPGDPPNPVIKPTPLTSSLLAGGFFTTHATWEARG